MKKWRNGGKRGQKEAVVITAVDGTAAGKIFNFGCVGDDGSSSAEGCSCFSPAVSDRYVLGYVVHSFTAVSFRFTGNFTLLNH